jgi:SpoIID/LytB domain protein
MKKILLVISLVMLLVAGNALVTHSRADDTNCHCTDLGCLDQLNTCLNNLNSALSMSINATRPLESQLTSLQKQVAGIKTSIAKIEDDIATKKQQIENGYADLVAKQTVLNAKIRDLYIKNYFNSPLTLFFSSTTAAEWTQRLAYQKAVADQDKSIITNIVLTVDSLQNKKQELEQQQTRLAAMKATLDDQSAKLDKVVTEAKKYQATLTTQIAELSSQQQNLLAQKYASLNISSSAYNMTGGCKSDLVSGTDPGFSPKIGFFSYGVPNRVGMNQFGAKGRAEAGKSYSDILKAYYNADISSGYNQSITIHVTGINDYGQSFDTNWNIEEYVKHIYEIPASWPQEALKAQAIAARSYALAYTNNGSGSICSDQHCQEVKQELNSQSWIDAVNATAGQVLTSGGQPIKAWFSSTHGGYVFTSSDIGWSSTPYTKRAVDASGSVNNFSDLQNNAYDKGSPWFYCDWGSRGSANGTAWLRQSEVADIVNAIVLAQADGGTKEHLYQTDKSNPSGTDTWDGDRVKQELHSRGKDPFNNVSSVSVDADFTTGKVTTVHVNGDASSQSFSGDFFKTYFNLRAPGNIQIVGPLFNIEIK